jgi:Uma2 family endonuclease
MTAIAPITKPISQLELAPGSKITIPNISWAEFETILQELGERRAAHIAYSHNTLELMVPLPEHEIPTDLIVDIVKTLLRAYGIKYQPFGSTTFKREGQAGVEPDACFYIQNAARMIGRRRLQPDDPPPDLAIESDVTSKTALSAYEAIGVPELWIYASGRLSIHVLTQGKYVAVEVSPTFSQLSIMQLIPQTIERAWQVGSMQALEEFEAIVCSAKVTGSPISQGE